MTDGSHADGVTDAGHADGVTDGGAVERQVSTAPVDREANGTPPVRPVVGVGALACVVAATVVQLAGNAPASAGSVTTGLVETSRTAALVGPALAAVAVATVTESHLERVGLLTAAVFAALAAVAPEASVPAAGALTGGGALAAAGAGRWQRDWRSVRRAFVVGLVVASVALSLGGAMGLAPAFARPLGSRLFLLGLATSVVFVRPGTVGWFAGGLATFGVVAAGTVLPFVTGAVVLVAGGVVGASLLVLALGVGGGVASTAGALARSEWTAAIGTATVLVAGVPSTTTRALAVVVGVTLLVGASSAREVTADD